MYAFKIVVTTLTLCMMIIECYAGAKTMKSGKAVVLMLIIIHALNIFAIWG